MKKIQQLKTLGLLEFAATVLLTANAQAVLRVMPWPLSINSYDPISARYVQVETSWSYAAWLSQVKAQNPEIGGELEIEPVARIQIDVVGGEERRGETMKVIARRAGMEAAWAGANLVCVGNVTPEPDGTYSSVSYVAYRVKHRDHLVQPSQFASLISAPTTTNIMLASNNTAPKASSWGDTQNITAVRLQLDNASADQDTFSGMN